MNQIRHIANAYKEKAEEDFRTADVLAFIQGRYMVDALLCTVGNMFGGKGQKFSYPEQAYSMAAQEQKLSEDEIERQRQAFIATLQTMEHNFNLNKKAKRNTEDGKR